VFVKSIPPEDTIRRHTLEEGIEGEDLDPPQVPPALPKKAFLPNLR
jgi:hypothetical protein